MMVVMMVMATVTMKKKMITYDDDDDADRDDDDYVDCVATALVKQTLVHKKGADHAGLNHMHCSIAPKLRMMAGSWLEVCWKLAGSPR